MANDHDMAYTQAGNLASRTTIVEVQALLRSYDLAMRYNHGMPFTNADNLASRTTLAEAQVLMRNFDLSIRNYGLMVRGDEHPSGYPNIQRLGYRHKTTGRYYRAIASQHEVDDDQTRSLSQRLADIFKWAVLDEEELSGRLLGWSGRIDGLQGCDIGKTVNIVDRQATAANDLALVLWHPNGHLGALGKLPKELRSMIYRHAFPRTFWQCYHTKQAGLTLLDVTHSSKLPEIFNISKAVREEVLDSVCHNKALEIIIGTDVIAANFPLVANVQAGQTVNTAQANLSASSELSIGIQVPSPRCVMETAMVRVDVGRVVSLLNNIASKQSLPTIRVSFQTNDDTAKLQHYRSDFEVLIGPFSKLKITQVTSDIRIRQPLRIDRLPPYSSTDRRDETCDKIELVVRDCNADSALLTYRQHMIDLGLELAAHKRRRSLQRSEITTRKYKLTSPPPYGSAVEPIAMVSKELLAFYNGRGVADPFSIKSLDDHCRIHVLQPSAEATHADFLDVTVRRFPELCGSAVESWVNGSSSTNNPFWNEGQSQFWK
jgi:hypothetical protein